jgi:hypothetical protein
MTQHDGIQCNTTHIIQHNTIRSNTRNRTKTRYNTSCFVPSVAVFLYLCHSVCLGGCVLCGTREIEISNINLHHLHSHTPHTHTVHAHSILLLHSHTTTTHTHTHTHYLSYKQRTAYQSQCHLASQSFFYCFLLDFYL